MKHSRRSLPVAIHTLDAKWFVSHKGTLCVELLQMTGYAGQLIVFAVQWKATLVVIVVQLLP